MISHITCALLVVLAAAGQPHILQSYDPVWDVGVQYQTVHIQVGDYVEWYAVVPFHTVYLGQQSKTLDAAHISSTCDISTIQSEFTLISPDAILACENYPMCLFVSGPQTCLESLFVPPDRTQCATAINEASPSDGVPQPVRVRHQFTAPGTYYSVCTKNDPGEPAGAHCLTGMRATIVVAGVAASLERTPAVVQLALQPGTWGIARYHDFNVVQGDTVKFVINRHEHDLQHVLVTNPDESHDCGNAVTADTTLVAQSDTHADNDAYTFNWAATTPGTHLFWCSQGPVFHCTFGMHVRITVQAHTG